MIYLCIFVVLSSFGIVFTLFFESGQSCAVKTFNVEQIRDQPNPVLVGTKENAIPVFSQQNTGDSGLDLTGLWWLRHHPQDTVGDWIANFLRMEELVSFANSTANSTVYPMALTQPIMRAQHMAYSNFFGGHLQMINHAWWGSAGSFHYEFLNDSFATFNDGQYLVKNNVDEWYWPAYSRELNVTYPYMMTRVLYGDGTAHPFWWPQWVAHMWVWKPVMWDTDDDGQRQCESIAQFIITPAAACMLCQRDR